MSSSLASKFDAKARNFAALAHNCQFTPKSYSAVRSYAQSLVSPRTVVTLWDDKAPDKDTRVSKGWRLAFDVYNFETVYHDNKPCTQLELGRGFGQWLPESRHNRTYSVFTAARRYHPILFNETHLRKRLRDRAPEDDSTAEEKFLKLGHKDIEQYAVFYLEAAQREILFRNFPAAIVIPTKQGLLLGHIHEGELVRSDEEDSFVVKKGFGNLVKSMPAKSFDHHITIGTWVDYESLSGGKEKFFDAISGFTQEVGNFTASTHITDHFLGIHFDVSEIKNHASVHAVLGKVYGITEDVQKANQAALNSNATIERSLCALTQIAETAFARLER